MSDDEMQVPTPAEDLRFFDHLIGTWDMTGEATGTIRFEWMDGGFFILQHVDLSQAGQHVVGVEVIGHLRPFGEEPDPEVRSRFYDSMGNTLEYLYEPTGERTLTIWGGEKGSPAYAETTVSEDGNTIHARWVWPGGGYETTGTRRTS